MRTYKMFEYKNLVELSDVVPTAIIDLKYATADNFSHQQQYDFPLCLIHKDIAPKLQKASQLAENLGLRLKIWDAYRPMAVQKRFYDLTPDDQKDYVAPPEDSRHPKGITIDLTLTDASGVELDMPTGYDDFSERAHSDFVSLTPIQIKNRETLMSIMKSAGFENYPFE